MYSSRKGQGSDHSLQNTIAVLPAARGEGVKKMKNEDALKKFLVEQGELSEDESNEVVIKKEWDSYYSEYRFDVYGDEYLVMDDGRAYSTAFHEISQTLWAFNTDFILDHLKDEIKYGNDPVDLDELKACVDLAKEKLCEGANAIIHALIDDLEAFVDDAIAADGRGHFISSYDGEEHEVTVDGETYYIYRIS